MLRTRTWAGVLAVALALSASIGLPAQNFQPTLAFSITGSNVTLNWTAIPGATGYDVLVKVGGVPMQPFAVGAVTTVTVPAPPGVYVVSVRATQGSLVGPFSNEVTIAVNVSPPAPPPAPTNFGAIVSGSSALLSWTLPPVSDLLGLVVEVVGGPFAGLQLPVRVSTSALVEGVPNGAHSLQIRAVGGAGISAPSNVLDLAVPGSPCTGAPFPIQVTSVYGYTTATWPQLPGALGYQIDVFQGGALVLSQRLAANVTHVAGSTGTGSYTINLTAGFACGPVSGTATFVSSSNPPPGPRGPVIANPCPSASSACSPSQLPNEGQANAIVQQVAAQYPHEVRNSCGNTVFLFRVLQALRTVDNRWGLNWKRGNVGDMSQDVLAYNYSSGPDEGQRNPYIYDIIGGHCGPSPRAQLARGWGNIDSPGQPTGSMWTIRPYLQAGLTP